MWTKTHNISRWQGRDASSGLMQVMGLETIYHCGAGFFAQRSTSQLYLDHKVYPYSAGSMRRNAPRRTEMSPFMGDQMERSDLSPERLADGKEFHLKEFELLRQSHDALDARLVTIIQYLLLFSAAVYSYLLDRTHLLPHPVGAGQLRASDAPNARVQGILSARWRPGREGFRNGTEFHNNRAGVSQGLSVHPLILFVRKSRLRTVDTKG